MYGTGPGPRSGEEARPGARGPPRRRPGHAPPGSSAVEPAGTAGGGRNRGRRAPRAAGRRLRVGFGGLCRPQQGARDWPSSSLLPLELSLRDGQGAGWREEEAAS